MDVPKNIFRNYDVRGIYPDEFNEEIANHLGKAFGTRQVRKGQSRVVVGRDDRESSPSLEKALIEGLVATGCEVVDVGITLTPVIHFLTCTENFDLGLNVTASHNPKKFNGLRIDYKNARSFYGDLVLMLRFLIEQQEYVYKEGSLRQEDLNKKYLQFLKDKFKFSHQPKVVINCGYGAASEIAPQLFSESGCDLIPINCKYDSSFPDGVPNPENKKFTDELSQEVLDNKADVGFVFDTDGDRVGVVDEKGKYYSTDKLLLFFAEQILKKNPGAKIVYDVKSSNMLEKYIKQFGGEPEIMRTGHPYFTKKVEHEAILGAEFSGHVYFSDDYFGYDDGLYAACRVLQILNKVKKPLSEIMAKFPETASTEEIKVDCPDSLKFKVVNLVKIFVGKNFAYQTLVDIDGIRVVMSDTGWFLIRASNTSPYLSIRAEGKNEQEKEEMLKKVKEALASIDLVDLNLDFK
jgi:phosphomannomutase/phosphoglucomutase